MPVVDVSVQWSFGVDSGGGGGGGGGRGIVVL